MGEASSRSDAQRQAEKRYNKKRMGQPSIPSIRLTDEEAVFCEQVFNRHKGTKKEAVLAGLKLLDKKLK